MIESIMLTLSMPFLSFFNTKWTMEVNYLIFNLLLNSTHTATYLFPKYLLFLQCPPMSPENLDIPFCTRGQRDMSPRRQKYSHLSPKSSMSPGGQTDSPGDIEGQNVPGNKNGHTSKCSRRKRRTI